MLCLTRLLSPSPSLVLTLTLGLCSVGCCSILHERQRGKARDIHSAETTVSRALCPPLFVQACPVISLLQGIGDLEVLHTLLLPFLLSVFFHLFCMHFFFEKNKIFPHEKLIYISYSGARKMRKSAHTHTKTVICASYLMPLT